MKALLSSSARFASAGVLLLSLFFVEHAALLFFGVTTHRIKEDELFRVVTCCDIPGDSIVANATGTATTLGIGACIGLLLGGGGALAARLVGARLCGVR